MGIQARSGRVWLYEGWRGLSLDCTYVWLVKKCGLVKGCGQSLGGEGESCVSTMWMASEDQSYRFHGDEEKDGESLAGDDSSRNNSFIFTWYL